ncbi:hypothetical protein CRUP_005988 [Coryphaenoides rupestris]|nr:hypothetical protein CRUP_005988 [Coryphaenoides rupestris]
MMQLATSHLFYKFGIGESDWYRIKQSIDSKCRTAWRRKQRGQSLAVKSFSKRTPRSSGTVDPTVGSGRRQNTILVKVPGPEDSQEDQDSGSEASDSVSNSGNAANTQNGQTVTLITLNSEGTWLGDDSNLEMRVRCPISAADMLHVTTNCRTAEKMALTLLDYLFHREIQAMSNLSGQGKHGKKQLDPLMIYGIRCHLFYKFGIGESDWYRIKQSIDSKDGAPVALGGPRYREETLNPSPCPFPFPAASPLPPYSYGHLGFHCF